MINMDFTKIAYHATDNDVRIYMETSNGIQMNNKDYSKVEMDLLIGSLVSKTMLVIKLSASAFTRFCNYKYLLLLNFQRIVQN